MSVRRSKRSARCRNWVEQGEGLFHDPAHRLVVVLAALADQWTDSALS
jgi:hypothetical protein